MRYDRATLRRFTILLVILAAACVPGFALTAGWSRPHAWPLLAGLLTFEVVMAFGEVRLRREVIYAPHEAIDSLLLVFGGPIALAIGMLSSDLTSRVIHRRLPVISPGSFATYVSYPVAALCAAAALHGLEAAGWATALAIIPAGLLVFVVNWAVAGATFTVMLRGGRLRASVTGDLFAQLPAPLALQLVAGLCVLLHPLLGIGVLVPLALFTALALLPLPALLRARYVARLPRSAATEVYVRALARHFGLGREVRERALAAVELLDDPALATARPGTPLVAMLPAPPSADSLGSRQAQRARWVALLAQYRWDGSDLTGYPEGELLPPEARLVAIAHEWARLTAPGGPQLTHQQAIAALKADAGTRLDPWFVDAAGTIVSTQARFIPQQAFAPTLPLLPGRSATGRS